VNHKVSDSTCVREESLRGSVMSTIVEPAKNLHHHQIFFHLNSMWELIDERGLLGQKIAIEKNGVMTKINSFSTIQLSPEERVQVLGGTI